MSSSPSHLSTKRNKDGDVIVAPSKAFLHGMYHVSVSLIFFIIMYLLLVAAFLGLAGASIWAGIFLLTHVVNFITIAFSFGIVILNLMVIFFLFKFIFQKSVTDRSGMIEITREDEPKLFQMIQTVTDETHAPFPKKVYLTANVNAGVFYDSNFWSMFFPVRKNLQIGLGLVNSTNMSEFKAILAHEFAHFSQKSMRFGSYVYLVNSIIHNMLYDNEGYSKVIARWGNMHGLFTLFARMTVWIVGKIQWLMQKLYTIVNYNYLELSREMEFHADAVATVTVGSNNMRTALLRLEPGDLCYNKMLEFYELWINDNLKPDNIYPQHRDMIRRFALDNDFEWKNDDIVIDENETMNITPRRINIKDQWSSHPSLTDRIQHIKFIDVEKRGDVVSAWELFSHPEEVQKEMTTKLYEKIEFEEEPQTLDIAAFGKRVDDYFAQIVFDHRFKGYFDTHDFDKNYLFEELSDVNLPAIDDGIEALHSLLTKENLLLPKQYNGLKADIALLDEIIGKRYVVKTFDFDGDKLNVMVAPITRQLLVDALAKTEQELMALDRKLIKLFYSRATTETDKMDITTSLTLYINSVKTAQDYLKLISNMFETIRPFYEEKLTVKKATALNEKTKIEEIELKQRIADILDVDNSQFVISDSKRGILTAFLEEDRPYFEQSIIREGVFKLLVDALNTLQDLVINKKHDSKGRFLNLALEVLERQH